MKLLISNFKFLVSKYWKILLLIVCSVAFFFVYSYLAYDNIGPKFTWPDEMANNYFINIFSATGQMKMAEPLNELAGNLLVPRSFNFINGNLVPGTFLGFDLIYGLISWVIGMRLILFVTPLLAALIPLFFYFLIKRVFEDKIALISALALYALAPFWYYSSLVMLPTAAFLFFLILGFALIIRQKKWQYLLGFISIGLTLGIRTSETIWVFGILILLAIFYKRYKLWDIILAILGIVIALAPILFFNQQTFGSALSFGYLPIGDNGSVSLPTEFVRSTNIYLSYLQSAIMPFGFAPLTIMKNFYLYGIKIFWYLLIPGFLGAVLILKQYRIDKNKLAYVIVSALVSLLILIYYGSWVFADPLTMHLNVLGLSYVRYFLPIFILALPLAVFLFGEIVKKYKPTMQKVIIGLIVVLYLGVSINQVYYSGLDNLKAVKSYILSYHFIAAEVLVQTEDTAIIMTDRADKIFFPQRRVIPKWDWTKLDNLKKIITDYPIYYLGYDSQAKVDELNKNFLITQSLELSGQKVIADQYYMYKLKILD